MSGLLPWHSSDKPRYSRYRPDRCALAGLCLWLFIGSVAVLHANNVQLLDGFMVDRMEEDIVPVVAPETVPRRSLEELFQSPRRTRSRELPDARPSTALNLEVARLLRMADQDFDARRYKDALKSYKHLLRLRPGHLPYLERAAILAALAEQYPLAEAYLQEVLREKPAHPNYLGIWAGVLIQLERYAEAKQAVERSLAVEPNHVVGRYYQAALRRAEGEGNTETTFWLNKRLPELVEIASLLASDRPVLERWLGKDVFAALVRDLLGEVQAEQLNEAHRLLREAQSQLARENWESAFTMLSESQSIGVDRPFIELEKARCALEAGSIDAAVARANAVMDESVEDPDMAYAYAYILLNAEVYQRTVALLRPHFQEEAEDPHIDFAYACALAGIGRMDEAWPIWRTVADRHPELFAEWTSDEAPYLAPLKGDPRYAELSADAL